MAITISLILLLINFIFTLFLIIFILWEWSVLFTRRTQAPFIPVPKTILPTIVKILDVRDDSIVYDLGCGDGRLLISCFQSNPRGTYVGIEKAIFPFWLARFKLRKIRSENVKIIRQNFFNCDLSSATHIFTYLYSQPMDLLLPKLQRELKPGARLVSCDFPFKNKKPLKVIDLNRPIRKLGKKLYVYKF